VWCFMNYAPVAKPRLTEETGSGDVNFKLSSVVYVLEYVTMSLRKAVAQVVVTGY